MGIKHVLTNPLDKTLEVNWLKVLFIAIFAVVVLSLGILIGSSLQHDSSIISQSNLSNSQNSIPVASIDKGPANYKLNFSNQYPSNLKGNLQFGVTNSSNATASTNKNIVSPQSISIMFRKVEVKYTNLTTNTKSYKYNGWETLNLKNNVTSNLLSLGSGSIGASSNIEYLGSTSLISGSYSDIKLYIASATAEINGVTQNLVIPSNDYLEVAQTFAIHNLQTTYVAVQFSGSQMVEMINGKYYLVANLAGVTVSY